MSYRTHTADVSSLTINYDTVLSVDEAVGYEHTTDEAGDYVLMLDDGGNQEAMVLTGTGQDFVDLANRILAAIGDTSLERRVAHDLHQMHDSTGISVDDWPDGRAFIEKYDSPVDLHRNA
jgi:hypothetical protein